MRGKLIQTQVDSLSHANDKESEGKKWSRNMNMNTERRSCDLKEAKEPHDIHEKENDLSKPSLAVASACNKLDAWIRVPRMYEVIEDLKSEINMSDLLDSLYHNSNQESYSYRNVHKYVIADDSALVFPSTSHITNKSKHSPYVNNFPLSCGILTNTDATVNATENDSVVPTTWNVRERDLSGTDVLPRERRSFSDTVTRQRGLFDVDVITRERRVVSDAIARERMCFSDATSYTTERERRRSVFTARNYSILSMPSPLENCLPLLDSNE
jgi:hypothetical protein